MRVGNAAVDDCISSQGLPDFYFSLFPSLFLSWPLSLFSSFPASFFLPLSFSARLLSPCRGGGQREGGCSSVEEATVTAAKEEEARTETLICFFRYSPYFPLRRRRRCRRRPRMLRLLPSFPSLSLSLSLSLTRSRLLASHPSLSRARASVSARIPSQPGRDSANGLSAPRTALYFYCNLPLPPIPPSFPRAPTAPSLEFFLAALLFRFFFLSPFLLSTLALAVVSNLAKGWQRECAPRAVARVFFLLPPPARRHHPRPTSTYTISALFSPLFSPFSPALSFLAYTRRAPRAGASALVAAPSERDICRVNGPLFIRATIAIDQRYRRSYRRYIARDRPYAPAL